MADPLVSIIIPCRNEGEHIKNTINSIRENTTDLTYEIIVVDDASGDGCCDFIRYGREHGVTLLTAGGVYANRARNLGASRARGEIFVFCDAHIFVEEGWLAKLASTLSIPGIDAVSPGLKPYGDYRGPSWGGLTWGRDMNMQWLAGTGSLTPVPVLPAGCLAVARHAFETVGGFDQRFRVYGFEDVEFTLKLWLFGFGAYVNPDITFWHIFREAHPYEVNWADVHHNLLRIAFLHLNYQRIGKVLAIMKNAEYFPRILAEVLLSPVLEDRKNYLERRLYDDEWFVRKFNIPL